MGPGLGGAARLAVGSLLILGGVLAVPARIHAADPSPNASTAPTSRPATCAERYAVDGPGGVDLRLGCVVSELVGYFGRLGPSHEPQRLTAYLLPIGAVALALVAILLAARRLNRRAARRVAPATPVAWWSCPACRSLNPAGRSVCYRCGRPFHAGDVEMRTDAEPPAPQSFGRRQDRP